MQHIISEKEMLQLNCGGDNLVNTSYMCISILNFFSSKVETSSDIDQHFALETCEAYGLLNETIPSQLGRSLTPVKLNTKLKRKIWEGSC